MYKMQQHRFVSSSPCCCCRSAQVTATMCNDTVVEWKTQLCNLSCWQPWASDPVPSTPVGSLREKCRR